MQLCNFALINTVGQTISRAAVSRFAFHFLQVLIDVFFALLSKSQISLSDNGHDVIRLINNKFAQIIILNGTVQATRQHAYIIIIRWLAQTVYPIPRCVAGWNDPLLVATRPRLNGLRSHSIVRGQDWLGRPLGRHQSAGRRPVDARRLVVRAFGPVSVRVQLYRIKGVKTLSHRFCLTPCVWAI